MILLNLWILYYGICEASSMNEGLRAAFKKRAPTRMMEKKLLRKRDSLFDATVYETSYGGSYYINVTIPSINRTISAVLDTGSSDFWIDASVFDPSTSNTYCSNGTTASETYVSGSIEGNWGYDNFKIGTATVQNLSFISVTEQSTTVNAILGIGYPALETSFLNDGVMYENLPALLKSQGVIETNMYSVYLDALSSDGSILFGGIDSSVPEGVLSWTDNYQFYGYDMYPAAEFGGVYIEGSGTTASGVALLDTGSVPLLVPSGQFDSLNQAISSNATYDSEDEVYLLPCVTKGSTDDKTVVYQFDSFNISASVYDLQYVYDEETSTCYTGIFSSGLEENYYVLGDVFLQSVYLVVDQENERVGLAAMTTLSSATSSSVSTTSTASTLSTSSSLLSSVAADSASFSIGHSSGEKSSSIAVASSVRAAGTTSTSEADTTKKWTWRIGFSTSSTSTLPSSTSHESYIAVVSISSSSSSTLSFVTSPTPISTNSSTSTSATTSTTSSSSPGETTSSTTTHKWKWMGAQAQTTSNDAVDGALISVTTASGLAFSIAKSYTPYLMSRSSSSKERSGQSVSTMASYFFEDTSSSSSTLVMTSSTVGASITKASFADQLNYTSTSSMSSAVTLVLTGSSPPPNFAKYLYNLLLAMAFVVII